MSGPRLTPGDPLMRRPLALFAAAVLLLASAAAGVTAAPRSTDLSADPTGRWIVVLKPGTDAFRGYAARLNRDQVTKLKRDGRVAMVVPDEAIHAEGQIIPTGISRVGAIRSTIAAVDNTDTRVDADVAIVDTGITAVADLNVIGGYSCANTSSAAWNDLNGHGTHVAGTVGAIDNGSGVVGVAPGVRLWAVKILDASGSGLLSWYLCGLDWITTPQPVVLDRWAPGGEITRDALTGVANWRERWCCAAERTLTPKRAHASNAVRLAALLSRH